MIGTATDKDVNELHVNVDYIKKHEQELEEAVLINTNATANIAKNVTAFVQQWNEAVMEDVSTMRKEMAAAVSTTTKDGTSLGRSIEIINQNEYYLFTATRLELAAADCR
jgi:PBP1b-binding outer membrane lipoprotein LpoB